MSPNKKKAFFERLIGVLVFGLGIPVLGSLLSAFFIEDWRFAHEPIHAVVESCGAFIAFGIVALIVKQKTHLKLHSNTQIWIVCALLAMGFFDLFHAANHVGNNFIWMHSLASFAGGVLFAGVCLPKKSFQPTIKLAYCVVLAVVLISALSLLYPQYVPAMIENKQFSHLARLLNLIGGLGYLFAFVYLLVKYFKSNVIEEYLLSAHCLLFGVAGILFEFSVLWDFSWWWWHALRLFAYMILLFFFYESFRASDQLRIEKESTEKMLETYKRQAEIIKKQSRKMEKIALTDKLTGVSNRHDFEVVLDNLIESSDPDTVFTLLLIDIDNFKDINDTYGHDVGDMCLKEVANAIKKATKNKHFVSRLGGDEFVVITYLNGDIASAGLVAEAIKKQMKNEIKHNSFTITMTLSIGIACFPIAGRDRLTLLRHADLALYKSKSLGKDRFSFFTAKIQEAYNNKTYLYRLLDQPFDEVFDLAFQPIYSLQTVPKIAGVEVLLRTINEMPKSVSVEDLINIAESKKCINELTYWIMRTAIMKFNKNLNLFNDLYISFNLSPVSFHDQKFVENIINLVERNSFGSHKIIYELTESALMGSKTDLRSSLVELCANRAELALDDFGKGQSSLIRLAELPVSIIKLDKVLIQKLHDSKNTIDVVRTMVDLAHSLGMRVIAEGVEMPKHLEALIKLDCDFAQGFYLKKPLNYTRLLAMLAELNR